MIVILFSQTADDTQQLGSFLSHTMMAFLVIGKLTTLYAAALPITIYMYTFDAILDWHSFVNN